MHVRGFPNCFIFSIVQSGFSVNFPHMLDEQARHLAYILEHAQENDIKVIEASQEAEDAWVQTILDCGDQPHGLPRVVHARLLQQRGPPERSEPSATVPTAEAPIAFVQMWEAWRAAGDLEGLELTM